MNLVLTDTQRATAHLLAVLDKKGNPAKFQDGSIVWNVSDPDLVSVTPSTDGLAAVFSTEGKTKTGNCSYSVSGDADLGDGVDTLSQSGVITVVGGSAKTFNVGFDAPEEVPDVPVATPQPAAVTATATADTDVIAAQTE